MNRSDKPARAKGGVKSRGLQPTRPSARNRTSPPGKNASSSAASGRSVPRLQSGGQNARLPGRPGSAALPARAEEPLADRRKRARQIVAGLRGLYPQATCALHHRSALELLIATILSAQSTDETVNKVTPVLFERYPSAEDLAAADPADVERIVHATGFFRQKTKSIIGACRKIVESFNGQVPDAMDDLTQLSGVARKTANVVLGTWFGRNDGVVVDTHIGRLSHRLGLTWTSKDDKDAVRTEKDLMEVLPRDEWTYIGHALIWHGRRVCTARKPRCGECALNKLCPSAFTLEGASGEGRNSKNRGL